LWSCHSREPDLSERDAIAPKALGRRRRERPTAKSLAPRRGRLHLIAFGLLALALPAHAFELDPQPGCWSYTQSYAQANPPQGTTYFATAPNRALPTNRWWSSLGWSFSGTQPHSERLYPHPLAVAAEADGLGLVYPDEATVASDGRFYEFLYLKDAAGGWDRRDLLIGVVGLDAAATTVADFSDWTVTARWDDGNARFDAVVGHGLPFVYVKDLVGTARVALNATHAAVEVWHAADGTLGITVDGHHYGVFAPPGSQWLPSGGAPDATEWTSTLGGADFFSVALLPDRDAATLQHFRERAFAFVTDTRVDWSFDPQSALLTTTYSVTTNARVPGLSATPLLGLYPHQWKHSSATPTAWSYATPRGPMKLVEAHQFQTARRFHGVLPALPALPGATDPARLTGYLEEALADAEANGFRPDTYFGGKDLAKLANLLPLMEQQGLGAERDRALALLQSGLQDWFDASDDTPPLFHYHAAWDTLVGYPASFGSDDQLNDHHFHWGYLIQTAAAVARHAPGWAHDTSWGGMVEMLIRDAANPSRDDPDFPFLRNFDVYAGHSWASGHGNFAHGNNQESSSEDMNFATGLILWGEVTGDAAIRDLGIYLYTTESAAIENYWFDVDGDVFPAAYPQDTAAIVWGAGGVYGTWWTGEPEAIHGINFLPFHGGSLYLGHHPANLAANYANLVRENGGPEGTGGGPNDWTDVIWLAQALHDPDAALAKFEAQRDDYAVESGETRAHTYHWIANLAALGRVDPSRWADRATTATFSAEGLRTYAYYNAGCAPDSATFSDGTVVAAGPRTLTAQRAGEVVGAWTLGGCAAAAPASCEAPPGPEPEPPQPGDPLRLYLGDAGLSTTPTSGGTAVVPAASEPSIGQLPAAAESVLTFTLTGLHATAQAGTIRFALPLNAATVANAVHVRVRVDRDGDSQDDYTALYHYFPVDAAESTWEDYTEAQGPIEEFGTLGDLVDGVVHVELWSAFGNGDTEVDRSSAWLELPYQFAESGSPPAVPLSTPSGLLALVGCLLLVAHRVGRLSSRARGADGDEHPLA